MRNVCALALVCCVATTGSADPRKVLVLRADSTTDWATRSTIESGVLGLARNVDRYASLTDSSFKDLAAMLGCTSGSAKCKDPVIESLAITEAVLITIKPVGGDSLQVTVQRATKGGIRAHTAVIAKNDQKRGLVAQFGPLFGASKIVEPPPAPKRGPPPKGNVAVGGATVSVTPTAPDNARANDPGPTPSIDDEQPPSTPPPSRSEPLPPPTVAKSEASEPPVAATIVTPASEPTDDGPPDDGPRDWRRPVGYGALAGGTALVLVGAILWQRASSTEDQVLASSNRTPADVARLLDLEAKGDRYASWGNVTFIGGLAIAGVGGYLVWRVRRDRTTTASVTPLVVDGGGGVAVHWEVP